MLAVGDIALSYLGQSSELMGVAASNGTGIRFYRPESQSTAAENPIISIVHDLITPVQPLRIGVEGVTIFHDELTTAHQTKPWPCLISVFGLDLVQHFRELSVRGDIVPDDVRKDFLVGGSQTEVPAIPVLDSPKLRTIGVPSSGFLP